MMIEVVTGDEVHVVKNFDLEYEQKLEPRIEFRAFGEKQWTQGYMPGFLDWYNEITEEK